MAIFSKLVTTQKGRELIAQMLSGEEKITFTKVRSSDVAYTLDELEGLEELASIKQTNDVSKVTRTNPTSVKVETVFTNTELTEGYNMRTVALYAQDGDGGEILYAAAVETSGNCFIPAFGGVTVSGAYIQLTTTVSNAENVTLEVDNSVFATIGDIRELQGQIDSVGELISGLVGAIGTNAAKLELVDKTGYMLHRFNLDNELQCVNYGSAIIKKFESTDFPDLNDKTYYLYVLNGSFEITGLGESTEIYEGVIRVEFEVSANNQAQWLPICRCQNGTYYTAPVHMELATGPTRPGIKVSPYIYKRGANNETVNAEGSFTLIAKEMDFFVYKLGGLFSTIPGSGSVPEIGSGGSNNYNLLLNKPSINNVTLQGNLTSEQLGMGGGAGSVDKMTYEEALAFLNAVEEGSGE